MSGKNKQSTIALPAMVRQRIRELRLQQTLTQERLCELSSMSVDAICRIENGQRSPSLETLERIAAGLGVGVVDLVSDQGVKSCVLTPPVQRMAQLIQDQPLETRSAVIKAVHALIEAVHAASSSKPARKKIQS